MPIKSTSLEIVGNQTIGNILTSRNGLRVPPSQRSYRWKKEHVEALYKAADELMVDPVVLTPESRQLISEIIKPPRKPTDKEESPPRQIRGVLQNLSLDSDWLEVVLSGGEMEKIRVLETGEMIDDIIGPMVNRRVVVDVFMKRGRSYFRDIQLDD